MWRQAGFISGLVPAGWQVMLALLALSGFLFWLYTNAVERAGAQRQANKQLVQALADERKNSERLELLRKKDDAVVTEIQKKLRLANKQNSRLQAKYQEALANDESVREWDRTVAPDVVIDSLCQYGASDDDTVRGDKASSVSTGALPDLSTDGQDERRHQEVCGGKRKVS